jgi:hypothetical protein
MALVAGAGRISAAVTPLTVPPAKHGRAQFVSVFLVVVWECSQLFFFGRYES